MTKKRMRRGRQLSPGPDGMNDDRSGWAGAALWEFHYQTGADIEDVVTDLLADLMHWCDRHDQDFETELRRAREHHQHETNACI